MEKIEGLITSFHGDGLYGLVGGHNLPEAMAAFHLNSVVLQCHSGNFFKIAGNPGRRTLYHLIAEGMVRCRERKVNFFRHLSIRHW
jgi:hypothetical protein